MKALWHGLEAYARAGRTADESRDIVATEILRRWSVAGPGVLLTHTMRVALWGVAVEEAEDWAAEHVAEAARAPSAN